jgi:hypothetical protein
MLTGPAAIYGSATSYSCTASGASTSNVLAVAYGSGSQFTIYRSGGGSEAVTYICIGN